MGVMSKVWMDDGWVGVDRRRKSDLYRDRDCGRDNGWMAMRTVVTKQDKGPDLTRRRREEESEGAERIGIRSSTRRRPRRNRKDEHTRATVEKTMLGIFTDSTLPSAGDRLVTGSEMGVERTRADRRFARKSFLTASCYLQSPRMAGCQLVRKRRALDDGAFSWLQISWTDRLIGI